VAALGSPVGVEVLLKWILCNLLPQHWFHCSASIPTDMDLLTLGGLSIQVGEYIQKQNVVNSL
jgi:hypothetical protein